MMVVVTEKNSEKKIQSNLEVIIHSNCDDDDEIMLIAVVLMVAI